MIKDFNHEAVEQSTVFMLQNGIYFLQAHRFGDDELSHSFRLFRWAEPKKYDRILDIGCGVGALASSWHSFDPTLRFTCLNINQMQLDLCLDVFDRVLGDMHKMPLSDGMFDMATCCFTIGHGRHADVFSEVARVLKPGGVFFLYDMLPEDEDYFKLEDISYLMLPKSAFKRLAAENGLLLDFYMEPQDNGMLVERVPDVGNIFKGLNPVIFRFIKEG